MNSISVFFLIFGATLGYCELSSNLDAICTHSRCDIEGDLQDDGLSLLQRGSVLKSKQHLKHMAKSATASGQKYDPENDVYSDVDVGQAAGSGSDSGSGSGSSPSSPSSPQPSPTPTPPPPSPTPTSAPTASPSPTPSTAAPSPTTGAPTTTTTTTYYNQTAAAGGARDRSHSSHGPGAMAMALIGVIIFAGSFCVNWRTEKAATMMETLYERADAECKTVDADRADPANRNSLVLVSGKLTPTAPVEDRKFNVVHKESAGIRSTVSIYAKDEMGGKGKGKGKGKGEEHEPQYKWTSMPLLSEPSKSEVRPGIYTNFSSSADLGRGFSVNLNEFHAGFNFNMNESWKDCSFGPEVSLKEKPSNKFRKANDNKYYSGNKEHPKENDLMVEFAQMENGSSCTVMALQVANKTSPERDTFLPYVLIPHTCPCYDADSEQEKEALLEGGRAALDADLGLENDDQRAEVKVDCWSLMSCAPCFGVMFKPEIRFIDPMKALSKEKVLEQMRNTSSTMKLICRVVGYLMLFFGIKWMFDPISAVLEYIPLIGGLLSGLAGFIIWVFALITSIVIYLLIKIVAAAFFHPARALLYTGVLAVIIIAIVLLGGSPGHTHGTHHKVKF